MRHDDARKPPRTLLDCLTQERINRRQIELLQFGLDRRMHDVILVACKPQLKVAAVLDIQIFPLGRSQRAAVDLVDRDAVARKKQLDQLVADTNEVLPTFYPL
ncbi:hypothetical protein [Bradyrhizobium sp. SZCCHNR3054]|uniref:hypothetical protein n=1 Tax=unclassified Bradyrhizobium TaxID=2631580 RepID=UPI00396740BD